MNIPQVALGVGIEFALLFLVTFLVERTIAGALKALKAALRSEFTTATGRINVVAMVLLVFVFVFSNLHEFVTSALSVEKPPTPQSHAVVLTIVFGLFFMGSVICVMLLERVSKKVE